VHTRGIAWMLAIMLAFVPKPVFVTFTFLCICRHISDVLDVLTPSVLLIMIPYTSAYENSMWP